MPTKTAKRILSITIKRMDDNYSDTSWMGEYSDTRTSEFSIDRAHSEDCASVQEHSAVVDELDRTIDYLEKQRAIEGGDLGSVWWEGLDEAQDDIAECDCGEHGDMSCREYRFFNPSFNYVDKNGNPTEGRTPDEVRENVRQDYERMEALNRGDWGFIGIKAVADIGIPNGILGGFTIQTITSGGLWGIESDSDEEYLKSVERDEVMDLRGQLHALGFSKRAIAAAVKAANL